MSARPLPGDTAARRATLSARRGLPPRAQRLAIILPSLTLIACSGGLAATPLAPVTVRVRASPSIDRNVTISFHPRRQLPRGGYYYAALVLVHYRVAQAAPATPRCAVSSDMRATQYGFPKPGHEVRLTLLPAPSPESRWCAGGSYQGAVYAVPHKPPCRGAFPCYGRNAGYGPCWKIGEHTVCGVVVQPNYSYSYPGGLPKPIDKSTRIVGRFTVGFAG